MGGAAWAWINHLQTQGEISRRTAGPAPTSWVSGLADSSEPCLITIILFVDLIGRFESTPGRFVTLARIAKMEFGSTNAVKGDGVRLIF